MLESSLLQATSSSLQERMEEGSTNQDKAMRQQGIKVAKQQIGGGAVEGQKVLWGSWGNKMRQRGSSLNQHKAQQDDEVATRWKTRGKGKKLKGKNKKKRVRVRKGEKKWIN